MKTKTLLPQIFIFILFISTIQVQAQGRNINRSRDTNVEFRAQACRIPDLSENQDAEITKLRNAHYAQVNNLQAELAVLRAEKRQLTIANEPNAKAINAKIDEMSKIQTQMQKNRVAHKLAVRNLLTEDQKVYYDNYYRSGRNSRANTYQKARRDRPGYGVGVNGAGARGAGRGLRDGSCRY